MDVTVHAKRLDAKAQVQREICRLDADSGECEQCLLV